MRHRGNNPIAWTAAAAILLLAPLAYAQAAASAETLYRDANQLAEQGRYAEACPKFAASQKLDPGFGTAFNLGRCLESLGKNASAWAAFQEAAGLAKTHGQADREAKATRAAAALEGKLDRMTIVVKAPAPGLVVRRGGVMVDAAAFGTALPVDAGKHLLEASAPGKKPFSLEVNTGSQGKPVTVEIPPLEDAPAEAHPLTAGPTRTAEVSAPYWNGQRVGGVVIGGAGLVGIIIGAAFGVTTFSKNSASMPYCPSNPTLCSAPGVALRNDAYAASTVSTVAFLAGGIGLASGVITFFTATKAAPKPVALLATPHSLAVHGEW